ncbi:MAG: hypothetical protein MZV63_55370 [Marinilabiliales bacterium]|nr:hypothetical protein [Marinilabiliales bacterium]
MIGSFIVEHLSSKGLHIEHLQPDRECAVMMNPDDLPDALGDRYRNRSPCDRFRTGRVYGKDLKYSVGRFREDPNGSHRA